MTRIKSGGSTIPEHSLDALARPLLVFAVSAAQILDDFLTSENRLGEFVEHVIVRDYSIEPPPPRTLLLAINCGQATADCRLLTAD